MRQRAQVRIRHDHLGRVLYAERLLNRTRDPFRLFFGPEPEVVWVGGGRWGGGDGEGGGFARGWGLGCGGFALSIVVGGRRGLVIWFGCGLFDRTRRRRSRSRTRRGNGGYRTARDGYERRVRVEAERDDAHERGADGGEVEVLGLVDCGVGAGGQSFEGRRKEGGRQNPTVDLKRPVQTHDIIFPIMVIPDLSTYKPIPLSTYAICEDESDAPHTAQPPTAAYPP